jgi:hypothetical protein
MCAMGEHIIPLVILSAILWTPSVQPPEKNGDALDAFQSTARTETKESLFEFVKSIHMLDPDVRAALLRARFVHAEIDYNFKGGFASNTVAPGKEWWTLSIDYSINNKGSYFPVRIIVRMKPDTALHNVMRAKDEYAKYAQEQLEDRNFLIGVKGKIVAFTWKEYEQGEGIYARRSIDLAITLQPYRVHTIVCGLCPFRECPMFIGTPDEFTEELRKRQTEWIQYYMGKREKPKPFPQ